MTLAFPANPTVNQQYLNWVWDGVKWIRAPSAGGGAANAGRFGIVGASPSNTLIFAPYQGNTVTINGQSYPIPAAGITATRAAAYVNGVMGQLAVNTTYYVYVWNSPGGLALDFSTVKHATSTTPGNIGTEIKTGDDSRTLVGMVRNGSAAPWFYDDTNYRYVRSWFNRPAASLWAAGGGTFGSSQIVVQASAPFVCFANENLSAQAAFTTFSGYGPTVYGYVYLDNAAFGAGVYQSIYAGYIDTMADIGAGSVTEGLHFLQAAYTISSSQVSVAAAVTGLLVGP